MTYVKSFPNYCAVNLFHLGASSPWHLEVDEVAELAFHCSQCPNVFPQCGMNVLVFHQNQLMLIQKGQKFSSLFSICRICSQNICT